MSQLTHSHAGGMRMATPLWPAGRALACRVNEKPTSGEEAGPQAAGGGVPMGLLEEGDAVLQAEAVRHGALGGCLTSRRVHHPPKVPGSEAAGARIWGPRRAKTIREGHEVGGVRVAAKGAPGEVVASGAARGTKNGPGEGRGRARSPKTAHFQESAA